MKKASFFATAMILAAIAVSVNSNLARAADQPADLLDALPDGSAVAVIDFQKITTSSLWAAINAQDRLKSTMENAQAELSRLGIKLSDVQTIAIAFTGSGFNNPSVAVTGGFEKSELLSRLGASGQVRVTTDRYRDFDIYNARSVASRGPSKDVDGRTRPPGMKTAVAAIPDDETWFVFQDARTLVVGAAETVRASVDAKTGVKPSIARDTKLMDALQQNSAAAVRFAVTITPGMTAALHAGEVPIPDFSSINLVFGAVDFASGIELNVTLRTDSGEHAKSIAASLNGLLSMVKGLTLGADPKTLSIAEALKTVTISNVDADVKITGSISTDMLNRLLSSATRR